MQKEFHEIIWSYNLFFRKSSRGLKQFEKPVSESSPSSGPNLIDFHWVKCGEENVTWFLHLFASELRTSE